MLSARAYSFRQKSRLAISLSWIGGFVDVVVFLGTGFFVSHLSGISSQFGHWTAAGNAQLAFVFGFTIVAFTFGAALSAVLTESAKRRGWRSKYILPMGLEAVLLGILAILLAGTGKDIAVSQSLLLSIIGAGAMAMGLQNATITRISGAVVRTTHLTGIFTDLGLEGVQYLFWWADQLAKRRSDRAGRLLKVSSRHPTVLRLLVLICIAVSFCVGAVAGTLAFSWSAPLSLLIPIVFLAAIVVADWRRPITDIRELDLLNDPELRLQGIISKLLPPEVTFYRASCLHGKTQHRAPNFQLWIDRVPARCRVLVLAVSPLTKFDANAVMDLENAVKRLHEGHKKLVLSGITTYQFKALVHLDLGKVMDMNNVCPDLEFAIARAMVLLGEINPRAAHQMELAAA